jgi:SprT protein
MTTELKSEVIEAIENYVTLGNKLFATQMRMPNADFSLRGRVGGIYSSKTHSIGVNMVLLAENIQDYLSQIIPHEVAHAFQRHIYGSVYYGKRVMPHGNEWKRIMIKFGKDPKRCHNYDTENAKVRKVARDYEYVCDCRTHHLTALMHKKISVQHKNYKCLKCKTRIRIKE